MNEQLSVCGASDRGQFRPISKMYFGKVGVKFSPTYDGVTERVDSAVSMIDSGVMAYLLDRLLD